MPVMKQGLLPEMVKTFTGHNTIKVSPLSFPNRRILRHHLPVTIHSKPPSTASVFDINYFSFNFVYI